MYDQRHSRRRAPKRDEDSIGESKARVSIGPLGQIHIVDDDRYRENEEQERERGQREELLKRFPVLAAVGERLARVPPTHPASQFDDHEDHGCRCRQEGQHCRSVPQGKPLDERRAVTLVDVNVAFPAGSQPVRASRKRYGGDQRWYE